MKSSLPLFSIILSLTASVACAESQIYTPKAGTAERKAIIDPIRALLEAKIHQSPVFVVTHLRVEGDWAFFLGTPKTKEGGEIDYTGTVFEEDAAEADEITVALLQKSEGTWTVVNHGFFTTDMWWHKLWENYPGCPASIFERS